MAKFLHWLLTLREVLSLGNLESMKYFEGKEIYHKYTGYVHCAAVTQYKKLFNWGKSSGLGRKGTKKRPYPVELSATDKDGKEVEVEMFSCSVCEHHPHTLFLTVGGSVYFF